MSPSSTIFLAAFHQLVVVADYGRAVEHHRIRCFVLVFLLLDVDGTVTVAGIENLCASAHHPDGRIQCATPIITGLQRGA